MPDPPVRELLAADFGPLAELVSEPIRGQVLRDHELPQPYRNLLAHDRDMTSTLESFIEQSIRLYVLGKRIDTQHLWRRVLLVGQDNGKIVEFGAIRIELQALPDDARADVVGCKMPLGAILHRHNVAFTSSPTAYFRIESGPGLPPELHATLGHDPGEDTALYGRRNVLRTPNGKLIADIVEVLPNLLQNA